MIKGIERVLLFSVSGFTCILYAIPQLRVPIDIAVSSVRLYVGEHKYTEKVY